jgi:hypothetical protein
MKCGFATESPSARRSPFTVVYATPSEQASAQLTYALSDAGFNNVFAESLGELGGNADVSITVDFVPIINVSYALSGSGSILSPFTGGFVSVSLQNGTPGDDGVFLYDYELTKPRSPLH